MSIHATFVDITPYRYDPYPYDPKAMVHEGHVFFCDALNTEFVRLSVCGGNDCTSVVIVDLSHDQLQELHTKLSIFLENHPRKEGELRGT